MNKQRERERIQREIDNIKAQEARKLAETLNARGGLKIDVSVSSGVGDLAVISLTPMAENGREH